jgi:hypothetical protein
MKKLLAPLAVFVALAVPTIASADSTTASPCGATHGAFANENGNFGWLGAEGGAAGWHGVVGQAPGATGYNNSHVDVCGL